MLCLTLRVETPTKGWCRNLSLQNPEMDIRVVSCFPLSSGAMEETVQLAGAQWNEAAERIQTSPGVERADVLSSTPTMGTLRLRIQGCPFPRMFAGTGIVPSFPFEVRSGFEEWTIIAREGDAGPLLDALKAQGIHAEVVRSGHYEPRDVLTVRQRAILDRAVTEGYYAYPRRITLTRLAEKLGIAKSTLSETLMVVERRLLGPPPSKPESRGKGLNGSRLGLAKASPRAQ